MQLKALGYAVLVLVMLAPQPEVPKLPDLIPVQSWRKTGISKLNEAERNALRDELLSLLARYHASLTDGVAVIAPSISTSLKAREVRAQLNKKEVALRHAETILVVVRSPLSDPLRRAYDGVGELQEDADNQLNIAGSKFHVYLYSMDDDLNVSQTSHKSWDAD